MQYLLFGRHRAHRQAERGREVALEKQLPIPRERFPVVDRGASASIGGTVDNHAAVDGSVFYVPQPVVRCDQFFGAHDDHVPVQVDGKLGMVGQFRVSCVNAGVRLQPFEKRECVGLAVLA